MKWFACLLIPVMSLFIAACGGSSEPKGGSGLTGTIRVDGSSTVFPITEAVAEEYARVEPQVRVTVGLSGTGGGFKKFDVGETDINNASRPITEGERAIAAQNGIEFIELPIAYDGLSVLVNPRNDWVDHFTVAELKRIWEPGSTVTKWSDVRPNWPDRPIRLYGAGHDSGTFDYFTHAINGKERAIRPDYMASEDDNTLVQGISGDLDSLGFFGFAYYEANATMLRAVAVDGGKGPVAPTPETINNGSYNPLSRPVFIYVTLTAANRPEVESFVNFYLDSAAELTREVGYIPLPERAYEAARQRLAKRVTGSVFEGRKDAVGVTIEELLGLETQ